MTIDELCKFLRGEIRIQHTRVRTIFSFTNNCIKNEKGQIYNYTLDYLLYPEEFTPYTEPPRKRKVTQYRSTYKTLEGYYTDYWNTVKGDDKNIVYAETREIEVDDV